MQQSDPATTRTEIDNRPVISNVHQAGGIVEVPPAEATSKSSGQFSRYTLTDLLGLALGLAQHQNVTETNRPLHVASDDSSLVPSLLNTDTNLDNFSCNTGPANNLCDLGRG